jgi:hypothetical protein
LACSTGCSFSKSWCGEAFHELWVQSANVSALPGALPQPSVSPASQQGPWFMELTRSAAVSSWILRMLHINFQVRTYIFILAGLGCFLPTCASHVAGFTDYHSQLIDKNGVSLTFCLVKTWNMILLILKYNF